MATGMLCGCSTSADTVKEEKAVAAEEEGNDAAGEEESANVSDEGVVTLDWWTDFSWYYSDNWEGIIPEEITRATGVACEVTRAADSGQLNLMIASGELPDIIWCDNGSGAVDRLCDSNLCYSYNELIEQYGIDWEVSPERIYVARTHNIDEADENFYTILQNYLSEEDWADNEVGCPINIAGLYYRKDIWEELGCPEMNTVEQIKEVMAMVKDKYPDMQVINAGNSGWRLGGFANWFDAGGNTDFRYDKDGNVAYGATLEGYHDYMKCMNEFFRNGYFTEESLALTVEADAQQQATSGKSFIYEWNARPTWLEELNTKTREVIPEAEWAFLSIPDDAKEIPYSQSGWAGLFISKNCKDPEAAIRLIAYLNSEQGQKLSLWGREGIDYEMDQNGVPQFSEEWKEANKDITVMSELYNPNYFCTTELHEILQYYSGVDQEVIDMFTRNADKIKMNLELSLAAPKTTSDAGIIYSKIKEASGAETTKLITAATEEEFEKLFEEYMELLDKIGVQELNKNVTETIRRIKADLGA